LGLSRQSIASVGTAVALALLSLTAANADSASDNAPPHWDDEVFAQILGDQTAVATALGYAKPPRSDATAVPWVPPQPMPAVDGINAKIDGYGGGENHSNGFYGTSGSLSVPLAQQWGLQLDGNLEGAKGIGEYGGGAHLFWRDPSIGLLGAYADYAHWNGTDLIDHLTGVNSHISANIGHFAAEGEYYLNRWTLSGLVGLETVSFHSGVPVASPPIRFFDDVWVSYYVTDNFSLSAGHIYAFGTNFLTLGSEYGFALGGGRMASLFAEGWLGERADNGVLAGLRIYFGQRDKSLMDRHRQDDPLDWGRDGFGRGWGGRGSDIRLKRDVALVGRLDNGLGLYRFRYLWSDTVYVGVMAQEVALLRPDAIVRSPLDSYLRVDYARLGLKLMTWSDWDTVREGKRL
jgi:hypothetical protein